MITLISPPAIPTIYPFRGYGGIERIVADLAHAILEQDHGVRVVAGHGSSVPGADMVYYGSEFLQFDERYDGRVIDFSHMKIYNYRKYSVPFWSDAMGHNPIFPTKAVRQTFGGDGTVVMPGIDLGNYVYTEEKQDYYLFLGRIAPYKGTTTLLNIVQRLHIPVVVAGHEGPFSPPGYPAYFRDRCSELGIEYIGHVNEEKKRALLQGAKGLIYPSDWRMAYPRQDAIESFGITAVEALASGTPVFTNRRPSGIREIIDGGFGATYDIDEWGQMSAFTRPGKRKWLERIRYLTSARYRDELDTTIHGMGAVHGST